jgi:asparagine synthetase B (glutamine-hydrolysing)
MHGIAGYVGLEAGVVDATVVRRMGRQLAPPGQDGDGVVVHGPVGLVAHHQAGPFVMAYAGEIFNGRELREELAGLGHAFTGDGDPEVILTAWRQWGAAALDRCNGRFAAAFLDLASGEVTLARDPIGGPPLYYAADGSGRAAFATELRAIIAAGVVPRRPDEETIQRYLAAGMHDDTERTFIDRVTRVMPGETVVISPAAPPRRATYTRLYQELDLLGTTRRPGTTAAREQAVEVAAEAIQRREAGSGTLAGIVAPVPERLDDLTDFMRGQQEPVASSAAYVDYCLMRETSRQVSVLVDRSDAADLVGEHLRQLAQPPVSHRLRRRESAPVQPRSAENLFRRRLPAVLRYQDRNGARFSVQRREPYLDAHLLRMLWSLDPVVLRDVTGDPAGVPRIPASRLDPVAEELFDSESFGARPYVDQSAVLTSYRTTGLDPALCWRLVNLELWLREFVDRDPTIPPASTFVGHYPKPGAPAAKPAPPVRDPVPAPADDDSLITVDVGA